VHSLQVVGLTRRNTTCSLKAPPDPVDGDAVDAGVMQ